MTLLVILLVMVGVLLLSLFVPPTRTWWAWLLVRTTGTTVRHQKRIRR